MSDKKIKFIVDDLADYTGSLLQYYEHIVYLPKKVYVLYKEVETKNTYDPWVYNSIQGEDSVYPSTIDSNRYDALLNKFVTTFSDCEFVYFKPYVPSFFEEDLSDLTDLISQKYSDKIHIIETKQYGSSLHFLILKVIEMYLNDNLTVSQIETLSNNIQNNLYSYLFVPANLAVRNKWTTDSIDVASSKYGYCLEYKNGQITDLQLSQSEDIYDFYTNCIIKLAHDLKETSDFVLLGSAFPANKEQIDEGIKLFIKESGKNKSYSIYEKSLSNASIDNDGNQISIYNI